MLLQSQVKQRQKAPTRFNDMYHCYKVEVRWVSWEVTEGKKTKTVNVDTNSWEGALQEANKKGDVVEYRVQRGIWEQFGHISMLMGHKNHWEN